MYEEEIHFGKLFFKQFEIDRPTCEKQYALSSSKGGIIKNEMDKQQSENDIHV